MQHPNFSSKGRRLLSACPGILDLRPSEGPSGAALQGSRLSDLILATVSTTPRSRFGCLLLTLSLALDCVLLATRLHPWGCVWPISGRPSTALDAPRSSKRLFTCQCRASRLGFEPGFTQRRRSCGVMYCSAKNSGESGASRRVYALQPHSQARRKTNEASDVKESCWK